MWASMTQDFYKMFQRATAELRDEPGGDGQPAHSYAVQAAQEIHSGGHHHDQGALMFIHNITVLIKETAVRLSIRTCVGHISCIKTIEFF